MLSTEVFWQIKSGHKWATAISRRAAGCNTAELAFRWLSWSLLGATHISDV